MPCSRRSRNRLTMSTSSSPPLSPTSCLDTIRSRSQRFDFHPVSIETLTQHLAGVAESEGYHVEGDALTLVARHAKGSVRDSLSLLEQVAALGAGAVQSAGVTRALGLADRDVYLALADAIANTDARAALEMIANLAAAGRRPQTVHLRGDRILPWRLPGPLRTEPRRDRRRAGRDPRGLAVGCQVPGRPAT